MVIIRGVIFVGHHASSWVILVFILDHVESFLMVINMVVIMLVLTVIIVMITVVLPAATESPLLQPREATGERIMISNRDPRGLGAVAITAVKVVIAIIFPAVIMLVTTPRYMRLLPLDHIT